MNNKDYTKHKTIQIKFVKISAIRGLIKKLLIVELKSTQNQILMNNTSAQSVIIFSFY